GLGRLLTTEQFLNGRPYANSTSTYNWQNQVTTVMDALGNVTSYHYDSLGRLLATTTPDGTSVRQYYNDTGSWTVTTDQTGANHRCSVYDRVGHLVSEVEYSDQQCHPLSLASYQYLTNYYYDELGNLLRV